MKNSKRGSTAYIVLIIGIAMGTITYASMKLVMSESRMNKKAYVYHEARLAAETLLESGFADLYRRFKTSNSGTTNAFPVKALSPANNPLSVPAEFVAVNTASGANSHIVIPEVTKYTSVDQFGSEKTEIIGGRIPPGEWKKIDKDTPGNQYDELGDVIAFVRGIEILAKATVEHPVWGKSTAYAREILEVREAPLFAYAIFYNVPMEIAPGPQMDVYGNVHSNADMWVQANTGLNFHNKVTTAGEIEHGRHPDSGMSKSDGPVKIANTDGSLVNMKEDNTWGAEQAKAFSGGWLTTSSTDWDDLSSQLWGGNVQSKSHGVSTQNPVGVSDYVEDTNPDTPEKEGYNSAYSIIQPVLNWNDELTPPSQTADPAGYDAAKAKQEVEKQKYSYKAGLTIKVEADGDIKYVAYDKNQDGTLKYDSNGDPVEIELTPAEPIAYANKFQSSGTGNNEVVTGGMHDAHEGKDLNLVELDVSVLKTLVHNGDSSGSNVGKGLNADDWGGDSSQKPAEWWNGVVYVEFPQQYSTAPGPDGVNPAIDDWGLRLINGETIPNPPFAIANDQYGLSIATNQAMYVKGDFNADGNLDTGSPIAPDNGNFGTAGEEAPAALIADAITFLSDNWDDAQSTKSTNDRIASDTEISAAILTGLVPSGEYGSNSYSGGVENFPRFLEKWSGKKLMIRGSIVALFESEVARGAWSGSYYSPPQRLWGFHQKFGEGYLPPGTPNTRSFRGRDFQDLSKEEYATHIQKIKSELN